MKVKELMTADVVTGDLITIAPCDDVTTAAHLMTDHKIGCLPVVDGGKLLGLVTESDFVQLVLSDS